MFSSHPRTRRILRLGLSAALVAAALQLPTGCGESKPAPSSGTSTAQAPNADASKAAPAVAEKASEVAKTTEAAMKDAAAKVDQAGAKAAEQAKSGLATASDLAAQKAAAAAKAMESSKAAVDDHAGHDHAGHDHDHPPANGANAAKAPEPQKLPFDPSNPDSPDPNSKARLTYEFGTDTKNFGKVLQGDVLNHVFQLTSSGEEDLVIKQAKPTCGCTVAQITVAGPDGAMVPYAFGNPIPTGRKVEIKATLHTVNKRGHAGSRINIFSTDPRGQTQLGLEAEVEPFFNINPPVVNFNTLSAKDTATDKATITTAHGERVKLNATLENVPQGLKVELKPLDADADGKATRWDLNATAGPGLVEGNLAYMVPLKSDLSIPGGEKLPNGQMPTYESSVTVMARVTGMIEFTPAFVSLGLIRPGQTQSRSIRLSSHDADFKVGEPKVTVQGRDSVEWEYAKYFSSVVRPVPNDNAVDIEVTLNGMPESLSGSFSGNLVIETGYAGKPEIKLPITGVCRGGAVAPAGGVVTQPAPAQQPK